MLYPGEVLCGLYQVVGELKAGGLGVVYKAYHLNLRVYVVVKEARVHTADDQDGRKEADLLKCLRHTYLPRVHNVFQRGGFTYTVYPVSAADSQMVRSDLRSAAISA